MKLLLVGAGALGSRHLQSCLKIEIPLQVYVVDPSDSALELAKQRSGEVVWGGTHTVRYVPALSLVEELSFDFLIVATGASIRYSVLTEVTGRFSIQYALLEKVLFQELSVYDGAIDLIEKHKITAFVNCPLRVYPFYRKIKSKYFGNTKVSQLRYCGGEWIGLACNSIHFLDLMNFLTGEDLVEVTTDHLDHGFIKSKRIGHIELTGRLEARFSGGSELSVVSKRGCDSNSVIEIISNDVKILVDELTGGYQIFESCSLVETGQYDLVYQSDLTHKIMEQICETKSCDLSGFPDSVKLHKIFIRSLLGHYNKSSDGRNDSIPIT